ncbi:TKL/LISK/LISK-DD1 protein Kinase, partial [Phytophthora palmivora]
GPPLTCKLSDDQVTAYVSTTNFTPEEVVALHAHYDFISSAKRDDGLIDRSEFQTALGFTVKESLYVDRIFQLFDTNNDNFISFDEFLQSVSVLSSKGGTAEKIKFSFDILDFDRDGKLSTQELLSMLEACIQENCINIPAECLATIVAKTMEDVDLDKDGFISFDEFRVMTEANLQMLNHVTFNVSAIIADYMPALRNTLELKAASNSAMLSRCLAATFCVNETCAVTDRRRALPSSEQSSSMSGNQRQVLLAGEYAQRRPLPHKSPLAAFTSQLEAQKPPPAPKEMHVQYQQDEQEQEQPEKQQPEWPEQEGVDAKALFQVEAAAVKIGREVGKGAFSIVYGGDYRGQHVAVKCQPKDAEGNIPAFVLREVQVLRLLHHPRLLQFVGAADNVRTKQIWILSEYLNNGDVDLLLKAIRSEKKAHIGWHRMVRIALDAAQGIEFLQQRHIVHRDIKSSNILLDDQHRAKLCDFGFAVEIKPVEAAIAHGGAESDESKQRRKSYCGTDAYMAPEMFLDEDYDHSVDIFSFGVVLMEMLCCRVANSDGFLMRLPQYKFQVLLPEFRSALPASCPSALATLAENCVSFEPSERPNITTIVQTLEDVLKHTNSTQCDSVELVPFTADEREPQIEEDDDAYYGENDDEDDDDDDEEEEDDEDEDDDEEEEDNSYNLQANGRHNTMGMDSDEEEREVRSQVVDDPFLEEESVDSDVHVHPASPAPYHEGVILKRSRRGKRSWVEKWFIVDHDQLHYTDVPPRWQQHQQLNPEWRCKLPPISSLSLRECRIWKTMEMPELRFNVIDSNWKIKRELQAISKRDLQMWMELVNQGIDYANEQYAREHDLPNNSTTGTSASSSTASRPSRNKTKESLPQRLESSKPQEQRLKSNSDATAPRKTRRRSSVTKFEEPPELPETEEDRADEVYVWLKQIGFQRYTPMLKAKGFDSLDFIRETGIEMEDLNFVGIREPVARKAIRSAARTLRGDDDD